MSYRVAPVEAIKRSRSGGHSLLFAAVQELNRAVIVLLLHIEDTRVLFSGARHGTPFRTGGKAIGVIARCRDSMIPE